MAWNEVTEMSLREEFVRFAEAGQTSISELCKRFGVSRKTGYKWLKRYKEHGTAGLQNHSRRPNHSPHKTSLEQEELIVDLRKKHPAWGGRKLQARLQAKGYKDVPPPSTITNILHRHGLIDEVESNKHKAWNRFEHEAPNRLWQMDFKGHFALTQGRCHPLTIIDDHSRFSICLQACPNETANIVEKKLINIFETYGLPDRFNVDNGNPWGCSGQARFTKMSIWLIRLGISVSFSTPLHPQTNGKDERFHRTLKAELLRYHQFHDMEHAQRLFDDWRNCYNLERPHEALNMATPASRYHASHRSYPKNIQPIEYSPDDIVRKVQAQGFISYKSRYVKVGGAFHGENVALRHTSQDGIFDVYYCHQKIATLDLNDPIN
ncbi:MAG: IS481 family transposase [Gammaproteobacteria bacterium]|jgi:transposase InsO family protein